jgi:hypothetical protein
MQQDSSAHRETCRITNSQKITYCVTDLVSVFVCRMFALSRDQMVSQS